MGLFKSKQEKELETLITRIDMNMSNNYKDAAQMNFEELVEKFEAWKAQGNIKEKTRMHYEALIGLYKEKLKGFTHKDQKPYWT